MVQYEIKVLGRVQGVGYRYFAQRTATKFGLKGWVKNTVDGNVLITVQGDETDIETFCDYLRIGPDLSRVDKLIKAKVENLSNFDNFIVKY